MFRWSIVGLVPLLLVSFVAPKDGGSLSRYNQTVLRRTQARVSASRRRRLGGLNITGATNQRHRALAQTPSDPQDLTVASKRVADLEAYAKQLESRLTKLDMASTNVMISANASSANDTASTTMPPLPPSSPLPPPPLLPPSPQVQSQVQPMEPPHPGQASNDNKRKAGKKAQASPQGAKKHHGGRAPNKQHHDKQHERGGAETSDQIAADIIHTNGLRSDEVAIFVLSAGTNNVRWKQAQEAHGGPVDAKITYYHTRALPAIATFGKHFPHLYFVFAGNGRANAERQIYTRCPLVEKQHDRTVVHCHNRYVLVGNRCTNNRKGFNGPCCRLDVSLEFFLDRMQSTFRAVKWWIFTDDDVYFRPHALVATLSTYDHTKPLNLAGSYPTMFGFGASKLKDTIGDFCGDKECVHWYPWQVVSILSRSATEMVAPAIRARGVEEQCRVMELPGHDVGFGQFLWMYQLDMVFLSGSHFGPPHGMPCFGQLKDESKRTGCVQYGATSPDSLEVQRLRNRDAILFHKVQNLTAAHEFIESLGENETELGLNFHFPTYQVPGYGYTNFSRSFNPRVDMVSPSDTPKKWQPMPWEECPKLWVRPEDNQVPLGSGGGGGQNYQNFEETFVSLSDVKKKSVPKLNHFLAQLKPPNPANAASKDEAFRQAASEFWMSRKLKFPTCRALPATE